MNYSTLIYNTKKLAGFCDYCDECSGSVTTGNFLISKMSEGDSDLWV